MAYGRNEMRLLVDSDLKTAGGIIRRVRDQ
jgi:hypothetical protein